MRIASFHSINGMVPMIILTQKHQILKAASHNLYLVTGFVSYYRICILLQDLYLITGLAHGGL